MNDIDATETAQQNHIAELAGRFVPNPNIPIESQLELTLFALLVLGEARVEGWQGKLGVAHVAWTRYQARTFGSTLENVILRPLQFSCFNKNDPNRAKMLTVKNDAIWQECFEAAWRVYRDDSIDPTGGANHYCHFTSHPAWLEGMEQTCQIGDHCFFRRRRVA